MARPLALARLKPLFDRITPGDATWPGRVQGTADQLHALLKAPNVLTDGNFAALASLADSVGMTAFTGSTLNRMIDAANFVLALQEFQKWVYGPDPVTGQPVVLPALIDRRNAEQAIFLS